MPSIARNKDVWDKDYHWDEQGDEWSSPWGGTDMLWYGSLLPRIHQFIPTGRILEIAPGFGRWTSFLQSFCDEIILVDLADKCIETCKKRFESYSHIRYFVNDGKSLEMIDENSIDFVFSFDSLVHADEDVIEAYVSQLATKLTKDGVAFIHHSNLGEFSETYRQQNDLLNKLPVGKDFWKKTFRIPTHPHWRGKTMTATKFVEYTKKYGLQCINQEIISWRNSKDLIDCISTFTKSDSKWSRPLETFINNNFSTESNYLSQLAKLYGSNSFVSKTGK